MLIIRAEQIQVFELKARARLEARMVKRVEQQWPARAAELGEAGVRALVCDGVARARAHGLGTNHDIACFIDLLFAVAPDFDAFPWAARILAQEGPSWVKTQRLVAQARAHLGLPSGPDR